MCIGRHRHCGSESHHLRLLCCDSGAVESCIVLMAGRADRAVQVELRGFVTRTTSAVNRL